MTGTTDVPFRRKRRWTFLGLDVDENVVFPESFVRLNWGPISEIPLDKREYEVKTKDGSRKISFSQHFTFYEEANRGKQLFEQFNSSHSKVVLGILKLYDGCGSLLEQWSLAGAQLVLEPTTEYYDDCGEVVARWSLSYQFAKYEFMDQK